MSHIKSGTAVKTMEDLSWNFEKRLELLWEMESSGETLEVVAARHGISVDLLAHWKDLYDAVSSIKLDKTALLAAKATLDEQTVLLEKLASALEKQKARK